MANPVGLSYDQAPAFAVPLGFFMIAPAFLLLAGALAAWTPADWLPSRWMPLSLALTHLLTLGFLGMVMLGALFQMLPVLLSSPVPGALRVARLTQTGMTLGALLLAWGLWQQHATTLRMGVVALGAGLLPALLSMGLAVWRARSEPWLNWPVRQAWGALGITVFLGASLAAQRAGLWQLDDSAWLSRLHMAWGLGGWVILLVIGVSFQLVPMLQLTPAYPAWSRHSLAWGMLAGLLGFTAFGAADDAASPRGALVTALAVTPALVFAGLTLRLQSRRRRKITDVTLDFWHMGLAYLLLCCLTLPWLAGLPEQMEIVWGMAFMLGFAASLINGMLYKIVPFLAWFHLQALKSEAAPRQEAAGTAAARGNRRVPNMKELLPETPTRWHLWLHALALPALLAAPALAASSPGLAEGAARLGALLLAGSAVLLWHNLWRVWRMYHAHRTGRG